MYFQFSPGRAVSCQSEYMEMHRLTKKFVTKLSSSLEEVTCFAAQWYNYFFFPTESGKKFSITEEQISKQGA